MSVESNFHFALLRSVIDSRNLQPIRSKPKAKGDLLDTFSRALRRLHVFASSSDWFIALFASVVIGHSKLVDFGFSKLNIKCAINKLVICSPRTSL